MIKMGISLEKIFILIDLYFCYRYDKLKKKKNHQSSLGFLISVNNLNNYIIIVNN